MQSEAVSTACDGTALSCLPAAKPAERAGFMPWIKVPEDFNAMGREAIPALFEGRSARSSPLAQDSRRRPPGACA